MRGLKPKNEHGYETLRKSHLLQMRGLKRETDAKVNLSEVASFTDAWIETDESSLYSDEQRVASFTDAWIETPEYLPKNEYGYKSRIFYRCVD